MYLSFLVVNIRILIGLLSWLVSGFMFKQASTFNQNLTGLCVQDNFDAEPNGFKTNANSTWVNDASKQPDWDGASCPP